MERAKASTTRSSSPHRLVMSTCCWVLTRYTVIRCRAGVGNTGWGGVWGSSEDGMRRYIAASASRASHAGNVMVPPWQPCSAAYGWSTLDVAAAEAAAAEVASWRALTAGTRRSCSFILRETCARPGILLARRVEEPAVPKQSRAATARAASEHAIEEMDLLPITSRSRSVVGSKICWSAGKVLAVLRCVWLRRPCGAMWAPLSVVAVVAHRYTDRGKTTLNVAAGGSAAAEAALRKASISERRRAGCGAGGERLKRSTRCLAASYCG